MNHSARQRQLRSGLERKGFDALLVTHMPNIRYLCGFTGSSGVLLVTRRSPAVLFTDGRYFLQASQQLDSNWTLMKSGLPEVPTWQEYLVKVTFKQSALTTI